MFTSKLTTMALMALPIALFTPSLTSIDPSAMLNSINPCLMPGTCVTPTQLNLLLDQITNRTSDSMNNTLGIIKQLQDPNFHFANGTAPSTQGGAPCRKLCACAGLGGTEVGTSLCLGCCI